MRQAMGYAAKAGCAFLVVAAFMPTRVWAQANIAAPAVVQAQEDPQGDAAATQEKLMRMLRVTPMLADVLSSDPSLVANVDYVAKSNPELAQFLTQHPEVGRNPQFYLFSHLRRPGQKPYDVLSPRSGFERGQSRRSDVDAVMDNVMPVVALACCCGALIWLIRLILQNRRWKSTFALHSEVHARLIEKFGTSQELMAYMGTEAGRKFLEAAPIPTENEQPRVPNMVSRVLSKLQAGLILTLLGCGLMWLSSHRHLGGIGLLALGVILLMPGIGCLVSAAMTWIVAGRLGLMPGGPAEVKDRQ